MTALELHRQHPSLDLAPILRVIKYMGFESGGLSPDEVGLILRLYADFEDDPELVVGTEAVCRHTGLTAEALTEILRTRRGEVPFLGTADHPMVPVVAIDMIRAIAGGAKPLADSAEKLYTLTEMAERTEISLASLSKYVKEHAERVPSRRVGKMRKFPAEAAAVFQRIKHENLIRGRRGHDRGLRHKASVNKKYATRFAQLEEQVDAAMEVSRDLTRTLARLGKQVRRARQAAETAARIGRSAAQQGARRSGGNRPDTIVAACKRVLAASGEPMRVADITERVIALGATIRAKNPNVTVSSILSSYDDFSRVRRGYYELRRTPPPVAQAAECAVDRAPGAPETPAKPAAASTVQRVAPSPMERDPGDVLAGLRTAAEAG